MSRPLKILTAALAVGTLSVGAASAQDASPQVARQKVMERNGDAAKVLGEMAKGERPYDAAVAAAELKRIADDTAVFVTLFPAGSETGFETRAKPEIWTRREAFDARAQDLVTAANAASEAATGGLDAFRPAFGPVGRACGACHDDFRTPRS